MAQEIFVGGEKGGGGKSFICRTLAQYFLDRGIDFALFDADRSNPDVKRIYSSVGCREAVFSENEKYEDEAKSIYVSATKKLTLVNLPAQIMVPFKEWFEKNELFDIASEDGVRFVMMFVCTGGYDSIELLKQHFLYFQDKLDYILIKNHGICDDWESLDTNEYIQEKINEYDIKVIDFPKFAGTKCRNIIDAESLTFSAAKEFKNFDSIDKQRIKSFLKKAYREFDDAGIVQTAKQAKPISKKENERRVLENSA